MSDPRYETPEGLRIILRGLFESRAVGRARALTMQQLLRTTDLWRYDRSHDGRIVRRAIRELVVIDKVPIAGDAAAGYYRCATSEERLSQCRQLGRRIRAEGQRMRIFAALAQTDLSGQQELDFSQTPEQRAAAERWVRGVLAAVEAVPGDDDGEAV